MNPDDLDHEKNAFRTQLLLRELGFALGESRVDGAIWSIAFQDKLGFSGIATCNPGRYYVELTYSFSFTTREQDFLRDRMEEFMQTCYQYGCYFLIRTESDQICISLYSKLYFSGLQYYALEETCSDLKNAAEKLRRLFAMGLALREGEIDGHP